MTERSEVAAAILNDTLVANYHADVMKKKAETLRNLPPNVKQQLEGNSSGVTIADVMALDQPKALDVK